VWTRHPERIARKFKQLPLPRESRSPTSIDV
jgi:hypothetical protein